VPAKESDMDNMLNMSKPDLLITGTSRSVKNEIEIWKAAKKRMLTCVSVIDYWMDPLFRFTKDGECLFPDIIIVPNRSIALEIKDKYKFDGTEVVALGHPYLESIQSYAQHYQKPDFFRDIGLKTDIPTVAYFSDTISLGSDSRNIKFDRGLFYGIDEKKALSFLTEALNKLATSGKKIQLIVKHHPSESPDNLAPLLEPLNDKGICAVADKYDSREIIYHCDATFSVFGMPLLEAHIMKKPAFSICNSRVEDIVWNRTPFDIPTLKNAEQIRKIILRLPQSSITGNKHIDKVNICGSTNRVIELLIGILNRA
jgi:hypothetical protein